MDPLEVTIAAYDATVDQYTENVVALHHREEAKRFLRLVPTNNSSNATILDEGCGSGRDAKIFSGLCYKVTGIDMSMNMLRRARRDCPAAIFQRMDMRRLAFADYTFDGVWSVASLLHLEKSDVPKSLSESFRVLRPRGIIYIAVKLGNGQELKIDPRYQVTKFYSYFQPEELEQEVKSAGFDFLGLKVEKPKHAYLKHPEIRLFARKPQ